MKAFLAWVSASLERLSAREQLMVLFIVCGFLGITLGLSSYLIGRDLRQREQRITSKTQQLQQLASLKDDYQRRLSEQNRLAGEIRTNNSMRLLSYIEEVSRKSNIDLGNAQERTGELTGSTVLKEEAAEVMVKNVSLDRLYNFLRQMEEGNSLVKVRRLKVKTRFDNNKMLDATVTVGTFKSAS